MPRPEESPTPRKAEAKTKEGPPSERHVEGGRGRQPWSEEEATNFRDGGTIAPWRPRLSMTGNSGCLGRAAPPLVGSSTLLSAVPDVVASLPDAIGSAGGGGAEGEVYDTDTDNEGVKATFALENVSAQEAEIVGRQADAAGATVTAATPKVAEEDSRVAGGGAGLWKPKVQEDQSTERRTSAGAGQSEPPAAAATLDDDEGPLGETPPECTSTFLEDGVFDADTDDEGPPHTNALETKAAGGARLGNVSTDCEIDALASEGRRNNVNDDGAGATKDDREDGGVRAANARAAASDSTPPLNPCLEETKATARACDPQPKSPWQHLKRPRAAREEAAGAEARWGSGSTLERKRRRAVSWKCKVEGCAKKAQARRLCCSHGGRRECKVEGCTITAESRGLCWSHGGRRECKVEGCTKTRQARGLCCSHGGHRECTVEGCTNFVCSRGLCCSHGGQRRKCTVGGCSKVAKLWGLCFSHGGRRKCTVEGCSKFAKLRGLCISHGGRAKRKKCEKEECTKYAKVRGLCISHFRVLGLDWRQKC